MISKIPISLMLMMSLASVSFVGLAQEREWWFDIEIIAYKRNLAAEEISEQFNPSLNLINSQNTIDILYDFVHPDLALIRANLPVCFAEPIIPYFPDFEYQYDESLYSDIEFETLIEELPLLEETVEEFIEDNTELITDTNDQKIPEVVEVEPPPPLFSSPLIVPEWTPPRILEDHACAYEPQENRQPFVNKVPKNIHAVEWQNYRKPYLLSQTSLELNDLAKDIGRKRGLTTLLHMGWRQQVFFGQDESLPLHLIAGQNYGDSFMQDGKPLIKPEPPVLQISDELDLIETVVEEPDDLITKIQAALQSNEKKLSLEELVTLVQQPPSAPISEPLDYAIAEEQPIDIETLLELPDIWELDGKLKIFLRYIGRTPYLHIDGQLDFRAPVIDDYSTDQYNQRLQSFEFKQLRRVITKQLHYFDHPLFGLLVQIRRYDFPPPKEEVEGQLETAE